MGQLDINKIINEYNELKSARKVADIYGVSKKNILTLLKNNGIERFKINDKHKKHIPLALEDYNKGMSLSRIRYKYGITSKYFKKILKENGLEYINRAKNPFSGPVVYIKENLQTLILDYNVTKKISEVAIKHNIKVEPLYRYFEEHNLLLRKNDRIDKKRSRLLKDKIYDMYKNGEDMKTIGKNLNISKYNVKKIILDYFGKEFMRSKSDAIRLNNTKSGFQEYAMSRSYYNKEYKLPSGRIIKVQGYEDHFLDFVFKQNFLKEEDFKFEKSFNIPYIDGCGKKRRYYPDFYIPYLNLVIEIKSEYTLKKQNSLNKFKFDEVKKYHNFILIVDKKYDEFIHTMTLNEKTSKK